MISNGLLILSWFFLIFGIVGIFRLEGVYTRLLNSAKVDSVTIITLTAALVVRSGFSLISLKLILILTFYLLTNPVTNQIIASSAYKNGIEPKRRQRK
ncbi:MAG: monovalent cation/H(+) antiporter subunit G [Clostridia bacterium]|nr:monovalent cation/H(+) antiporter subunit G [Clostridia bacterium]